MKITRLFHTLTAFALAGVLLIAPALAAPLHGTPVLQYEQKGDSIDLHISGLSLGHDVYAAQLTMELGGEYPNVQLTCSQPQVEVRSQINISDGTTLFTVYLDSQSPINRGTKMALGSLNVDNIGSLPQQVSLIFLDADLNRTEGTVSIASDSGSSGGGPSVSSPTVHTSGRGTVQVRPQQASPGDLVSIVTAPASGYQVSTVRISDRKGTAVSHTAVEENRFTFTQPKAVPVSIEISFVPETSASTHTFTDVNPTDWFANAVTYAYNEGLMSGISATAFGPELTTTRGMIVTILHKMEGLPAAPDAIFVDVPAEQYYAKAVAWAAANGIVSGYGNNRFGPNDPITREQMATILYSYAAYKGYDITKQADLSTFADVTQVSGYAMQPLAWANANRLINGVGSQKLAPRSSATRAQAASILMQFSKNFAK